jgi:hypothetical protein
LKEAVVVPMKMTSAEQIVTLFCQIEVARAHGKSALGVCLAA